MGRFEEIRTKVLKEFLTLDDDDIQILSNKGLRTIKHIRNLKMHTIDQWKHNGEVSEGTWIVLRSYIMWELIVRPSIADLEAMTPDEFMAIDDHQIEIEYLAQESLAYGNTKPPSTPHSILPVFSGNPSSSYAHPAYPGNSYAGSTGQDSYRNDSRTSPLSFHDASYTYPTYKSTHNGTSPRYSNEIQHTPQADSNLSHTSRIVTLPTMSNTPSPSETPSPADEPSSVEENSSLEKLSPPSEEPSLSETLSYVCKISTANPPRIETPSPSETPPLSPSPSETSEDNVSQAPDDNDIITPNQKKKSALNLQVEKLEKHIFDDGQQQGGTIISRIKELEQFIFDSSYAPPKCLTSRVAALAQEFEIDL